MPDLTVWWRAHLAARLGGWWAGDRVKKHALVESKVMGQAAVLLTATTLSWAAIGQIAVGAASHALNSFGQRPVDLTWGVALIVAAGFCWRAWSLRDRDPKEAIRSELIGIGLMDLALIVLATAVVTTVGWMGTLVYLALIANPVLNTASRGKLLVDRLRTVRKALR